MIDRSGSISGSLLARPGSIETPGVVKRRLLLVASIAAIAVSGVYTVEALDSTTPWTTQEQRDLAGLPQPPARFAPAEGGGMRRLSPAEFAQLQEIRSLVERFPVPDDFAKIRVPGKGKP